MHVTIYGRRCWRCHCEGVPMHRVLVDCWGCDTMSTHECLRCWRPAGPSRTEETP